MLFKDLFANYERPISAQTDAHSRRMRGKDGRLICSALQYCRSALQTNLSHCCCCCVGDNDNS